MSWLAGWFGGRGRGGSSNALMQIAREVLERRRSIQGALNEVRHPAVLDGLGDADFAELDEAIVDYAPEHREYAIVLARLTHAAARAKGFDRQIVDAALRLDSLLPPDDLSPERDKLLRDAYRIAQRAGYVPGGRLALARLGERAVRAGETERARVLLQQQLDLAGESHDTIAEVESALTLGDLLRRDGAVDEAQALYRRAGRTAQRLDHHRGMAEALTRQIEMAANETDLETLAALQRQALDAAQRTSDLGLQSRIVLRLAETLIRSGKKQEAIAQLETGRDIARQIGDLSLESRCLMALTEAERQAGRLDAVAEHEYELMELEERLGNRQNAGALAAQLGTTYLMLGAAGQANEAFGHALSLGAAIGDSQIQQRAYGGMGLAATLEGRSADALDYLMQALDLAARDGDAAHEAQWLGSLGQALWQFNQPNDAIHALQRGLGLARRLDDAELQVTMLSLLGQIYVSIRQTSRARDCYSRAFELSQRHGQPAEQIQLLNALAELAEASRQSGQAISLYGQALRLATTSGNRLAAARLHGKLGTLAQRNRDPVAAMDHLKRAVNLAETIDRPDLLNKALQTLGGMQHMVGDPDAVTTYERALDLSRQLHDRPGEARTLLNLGTLLSQNGQADEAMDFLYDAARLAAGMGHAGIALQERAEAAIAAAGGYPESRQPWRDNDYGTSYGGGDYGTGGLGRDALYSESTLPPD